MVAGPAAPEPQITIAAPRPATRGRTGQRSLRLANTVARDVLAPSQPCGQPNGQVSPMPWVLQSSRRIGESGVTVNSYRRPLA